MSTVAYFPELLNVCRFYIYIFENICILIITYVYVDYVHMSYHVNILIAAFVPIDLYIAN